MYEERERKERERGKELCNKELRIKLFGPYRYSCAVKFWEVLKELYDLAGQHEVIAENTQGQVIKDVQILIGEMKQQRKKVRPCQRHHQKPQSTIAYAY